MSTSKIEVKLVEFLATPGGGKTTVSRLVETSLQCERKIVTRDDFFMFSKQRFKSRISALLEFWRFALCHIRSINQLLLLFLIFKRFPGLFYSYFALASFYRAIKKKDAEVLIFDQGLLQIVASVFVRNPNPDWLPLLECFVKHAVCDFGVHVIYLDTDPEICFRRIDFGRDSIAWFDSMPSEDLFSFLKNYRNSVDIVRECGKKYNASCLVLQDCDAFEQANKIVAWIAAAT